MTKAYVGLALVLLAALAAGGFLLLRSDETRDGSVERVAPETPGRLKVEGRTHLSLCVDGSGGGSVGSREVELVSTALGAALAGLDVVPAEFGGPSVTEGCPAGIPLTGEPIDYIDLNGRFTLAVEAEDVDQLSRHLLFVYRVPDELYARSFGDEPFVRGVAEEVCRFVSETTPEPITTPPAVFRDNICSTKTVSMYVPTSAGSDLIADALLYSLGLEPPRPQATTDWSVCARGTPESWCVHYDFCAVPTPTSPEYCEEFWPQTGLEPPQ